ncbi:CBO0543 family protein [Bacillus sp. Marseille-P3661]|uniref:CBO0543 family protein n=1 Tax=Bacillus sp. Marseille-P3661 TaxID=1936234 RepID=UPI000C84C547|nr:CBO0543 family protein [Bacillus sp. Marseille-P3661]
MFYLLISVVAFNVIAFLVPKYIKKQEIYATAFFSFTLGLISDISLDLKYDLYGYFEKGLQLIGFLPIVGLFPASGILFLNFYPEGKSLFKRIIYILFWVVFSLFYEWTAIKGGYFYHNEWTFLYSALVYPVLLWMHLLHLSLFRYLKD